MFLRAINSIARRYDFNGQFLGIDVSYTDNVSGSNFGLIANRDKPNTAQPLASASSPSISLLRRAS